MSVNKRWQYLPLILGTLFLLAFVTWRLGACAIDKTTPDPRHSSGDDPQHGSGVEAQTDGTSSIPGLSTNPPVPNQPNDSLTKERVTTVLKASLRDWMATNSRINESSQRLLERSNEALPFLIELAEDDYSANAVSYRGLLLHLIGQMRHEDAWKYLQRVVENTDGRYSEYDRMEAARGLARGIAEFKPSVGPPSITADYLKVVTGQQNSKEFVAGLEGVLRLPDDRSPEKVLAINAIGSLLSPDLVPTVEAWSRDTDEAMRSAAFAIMAESRDSRWFPFLLDALFTDPSEAARRMAAQTLLQLSAEHSQGVQGILRDAMRECQDTALLPTLISAAVFAGDKEAYPDLVTFFHGSDDAKIRSKAISGIVALGDKSGAELGVRALTDSRNSDLIRTHAATALVAHAFHLEIVQSAILDQIRDDPASAVAERIFENLLLYERTQAIKGLEEIAQSVVDDRLREKVRHVASQLK